jgi:hypothetical protein
MNMRNDAVWAFVLGVITHIITDSQFHPFTYYFCGSPFFPDPEVSQKAACRHRMLETYLDLHFMQRSSLLHGGKLAALLKSIQFEQTELVTLLSCLFFARPDYPTQTIQRSIWRHKAIQAKFFLGFYRKILSALNKIPFFKMDDVVALFYPRDRDAVIPFFRKPFRYRHPVTGDQREESISDLEHRVIKMCQEIFAELESCRKGDSPDLRMDSLNGPSAYTGLPSSKSETMVHFDIQDVKKLLFSDA